MAADRPEPLTPAECDLRDFPFMPLEIARLRRSKSWVKAKRNPALGFYRINLYGMAWHGLPAGSLENDDDVLADLAMCDPDEWATVRDEVLRGWVLCSDDRWHHPVVAEKAREAWAAKLAQRSRTEAARRARQDKRQGDPQASGAAVTATVTETVTKEGTDSVTASKRDREGQERETVELFAEQPAATAAASHRSPRQKQDAKTVATREAYERTYLEVWKTAPLLPQPATNGQLSKFVALVGADSAPSIAEFYVRSRERFYVDQRHPIGLLLKDAPKLHTAWKTRTSEGARDWTAQAL